MALVLAKIDEWQFNTFEVAEATGGRCLSMVAFHLMKKSGLVPGRFGINEHKLARFLCRVEDGYLDNPYHCKCVTQYALY